ncbi:hypothetical protein JL100_035105 (plasmid) [Skermanella mucosa]|uniref:hypothetical protein n=1 Tax=Skermanella mucosa TaxID=1789672 RepID=UPI00192C8F17|nr:hypothetical protein [Skermanella mucosa]UEM25291.1 hypothetical protein JL100_035105 [Skermanella mucosa]
MGQTTLGHRELFNDPADSMGFHPFLGMVSMLGLFGWAAAAGIAFLTYAVTRFHETVQMRRFWLAAGLLTALLLLDDAFMLHEEILPVGLGIRERYVKLGYIAVAAAFGLGFLKVLAENNLRLVVAAGSFFALSFLCDTPFLMQPLGLWESDTVVYLIEDGAKFVGISLWMAYVAKTAADSLGRLLPR